jgi:peptidoglycan/xylan/chitin deacetylase (PgdA/CDA1 family)
VKPGDIMLLHDRLPAGSTDAGPLFEEVERILSGLREKKMPVLPLSELTGATIMEKLRKPSP